MRLWSVHPRYLDRQALIGCWRESLLAQSVLNKSAGGYANHPQLQRFRAAADPAAAIGDYLTTLADEASTRGYRFDRAKIIATSLLPCQLELTRGQLDYEWQHLMAKLGIRSPQLAARWAKIDHPDPNPLFKLVAGPVATWEKI